MTLINCVTEEVAKRKLCCGPEGCGDTIPATPDEPRVRICVGSSCMAWRFAVALFDLDKKQWLQPGDKMQNFESRVTDEGYCGYAGSPNP